MDSVIQHAQEEAFVIEESSSDPVEKVLRFLNERGFHGAVTYTEETIFTVEDASRVVGAQPEHILKSLVLLVDDRPALALMSGTNRVDVKKVRREAEAKKVRMADPEYVYEWSGFKIGGVPPVGYPELPEAFLDEDLFLYPVVWAAAGTDHSFFPIAPGDSLRLAEGRKCSIKK